MQLPKGTLEERQAAQARLVARSELEAALAMLQPPSKQGDADDGDEAAADAVLDAQVRLSQQLVCVRLSS